MTADISTRRLTIKGESELQILLDLLESPDETAAMTSAPPPYDQKSFSCGGKWRGSIPKSLVRRGIIEAAKTTNGVEAELSTRPTRKGSYVRRWRLKDRMAAQKRVAVLFALIRQETRGLFDEPTVAWCSAQ